ncbi:snRNA-activating protein complex subunit 4-like isoform X1 [Dioscorea cayenensis subsp. rotundata]|uniref:snRNA-activating protein complex subunit 4-like isoform X1 n=2 Tax=Dioscorea cayennensis subsp. rotundata TaxID=55577 RepID=A0AB40CIX9_DIOCR|nr:snRNA-activating protein complex subunit 4-like isoform X1 [Dioscorea cayenensis subsp. rotundata]
MAPSSPSSSSSSSSDCDESLADDLNDLRQALTLTGADANAFSGAPLVSDSDSDSADEDIDLLRNLQSRFSSAPAGDSSSPLSDTLDSEDESDEDLATLRAIQRRFSQYEASQDREEGKEASWDSPRLDLHSRFPKSCECFVEALKKNRACQRFIREKLIEIEAKIEENKNLKERVKCLMEFQMDLRRKTGHIFGQQKDARARLVSMRMTASMSKKKNSRKIPVLCLGPPENSSVSDYKLILRRFPFSTNRQAWSNEEREKLAKGIRQQYQELMVLSSMSLDSDFDGSAYSKLMFALSSKNLEVTPEKIRSFLPSVIWDRLASMYLTGRSGAECEARWLNHEDPLINHNPWTILEDKKLLFIVQERGLYNWIDIAITLGTHRTPFQCLARYQRSLNPHILKKDWTEEEDAMLRAAVENLGDNNWQMVSSSLEGRTGPQCSNRWRKSILPDRRVGRWSIDEDKRLKVAVMLFGAKNWNKIARFAPGRTQVQCRERWLNCLDPSLNLEAWIAEEDTKLLDAINTYGYCWSKVATCVPPRTDSQCRRRWKILLPHEVPLLQAARQIKRTALVSNFVDRESERPSIGPNDFCPSANPPIAEKEKSGRTRMKRPREKTKSKKQLEANRNNLSKKRRPKSREPDQNVIADGTINSSEDNALAILPLIPLSKALNTDEMRDIKRPRNKAPSDGLPKKLRAKSGSHHENFVAVDNIADNVLTDFSHVHVKDPNTAESRLSGITRKKSSRDTQPKKARTKPERSLVGGSSAGDAIISSETVAADPSAVFRVTSNGAASCAHKRRRKTVSRPQDGSRAKVF